MNKSLKIPIEVANRIDVVCDRFESAWQDGSTPDIGSFLNDFEPPYRAALIGELVALDLNYRKSRGLELIADYSIRFPELKDLPATASVHPQSGTSPASDSTRFIGPYRLLELLGEGGMGTVWLAEQREPVRRRVALKVVKAGLDNKHIVARFEAERQALAMMEHGNIASVFDAGSTEFGSPYFVMELVKGVPITQYCDEQRLNIRERLQLLIPVCEAVQHAHQKGIIHRDLKPSNVLVADEDDNAVPKVIDFGLAKALESTTRLTDRTVFTEYGKVMGTLQYMSPEQAGTSGRDVDTRTDIYSLGVMMYELLTGDTPIASETCRENDLVTVLEQIREKDVPRLGQRLGSSGSIDAISELRQLQPLKLRQLLRGDLEWITMKALDKDRNRRYATAGDLAADIRRYINGDPIEARPPSLSYRLGKFARRHRGLVATAATILFLMIAGFAVSTWFAYKAEIARLDAVAEKQRADQKAQDAIRSGELAEAAARRSQDVLAIVVDAFASANPESIGSDSQMTAADVLFEARRHIDDSQLDDPARADLLSTLTECFISLAEYESALQTASQDVEIRKRINGIEHPDTLMAMYNQGKSMVYLGLNAEALEIFQETFDVRKQVLGEGHRETFRSMNAIAVSLGALGRNDEAIALYEETLRIRREQLGNDHRDTIISILNLANTYQDVAKNDEAIALLEEAVQLADEHLATDHVDRLGAFHSLGTAYMNIGRYEDATPALEQAAEGFLAKLGPTHPDSVSSMNALLNNCVMTGNVDSAIRQQTRRVELMERLKGPDHIDTFEAISRRGLLFWQAGRPNDAVPVFEDLLERQERSLGREHMETRLTIANLGVNYRDAGQPDKAISLLEEVAALTGEDNSLEWAVSELQYAYILAEEFDQLREMVRSRVARARNQFDSDSSELAAYLDSTGAEMLHGGAFEIAVELLEECTSIREMNVEDGWPLIHANTLLVDALMGLKRYDEANDRLNQLYEQIGEASEADAIPDRAGLQRKTVERLIRCAEELEDETALEKWRRELESLDSNG